MTVSRLAWAVLAVACLAAATVVAHLWPSPRTTPPASIGTALQQLLERQVADGSVHHAVLAIASGDGRLRWSGAADARAAGNARPVEATTPIRVASITKLYTATVVMRLEEQGLLALDEPMAKYLPHSLIAGIAVRDGVDYTDRITLRQLLGHRSGVADYYDTPGPDGESLYQRFLADPARRWTVDETIARARQLRATSAPGTRTTYSDTNYQLLGKVIEAVTRQPLHAVYEQVLFRPLGLRRTWLEGHRPADLRPDELPAHVFAGPRDIDAVRANGSYWADGGIVSTADEMIVFLKALHDGRIVQARTLERMHEWQAMRFPLQYGYGTMRFALPWPLDAALGAPPLWGHSGSTGSFLYRADDRDLYVAGTLDQTDAPRAPFMLMARALAIVRTVRD
jgi:CubicO group peptidase (beta-lactamase class C family)